MKCPICGQSGYCGAMIFECTNSGCQNYRAKNSETKNELADIKFNITKISNPLTKVITIKYGSGGVIIEPPELAKQWHNNIPTWEGIVTAAEKDGMTHIIVDLNDTNSLIKDGQYTVAKVRTEVENKHGPF